MASLFPDDTPRSGPRGSSSTFRKLPKRPRAVETEMPPLPSGWVVAQCDGGARGNPGPAGFGAIVDDRDGQRIAELSEFLGFRTNNYAEYSGLLAVLDWALTQNHPRLRVIADSELMVKQIQGKYKVNSPDLKPLHEEARRRIARLEGFQIHHALRHKNKDADRLANEAMDRGMGKAGAAGPIGSAKAVPYPSAVTAPSAPGGFGSLEAKHGPETKAFSVGDSAKGQPVAAASMLRGFVRGGVVHLLGAGQLPDGSFVKIIPE